MERLAMMLLTLTVSTFFLLLPDYGPDRYQEYKCPHCNKLIRVDTWQFPEDPEKVDFFLFDDRKLYPDTWVFLLSVHGINLLMSIIIYRQESTYKQCATVYVLIHVVDSLFFFVSYGDPFKGIKLTWNISKLLIFGYAIKRETTTGR